MADCGARAGKYRYYTCQSYVKMGPGHYNQKLLNAEKLEAFMIKTLKERVLTKENVKKFLRKPAWAGKKIHGTGVVFVCVALTYLFLRNLFYPYFDLPLFLPSTSKNQKGKIFDRTQKFYPKEILLKLFKEKGDS